MKTNIIKLKLSFFIVSLILLLSNFSSANAQEAKSFTLKEAMDYAVVNSYKTKSAALDFKSTIAQRRGYISIGLPQVNASASYQYFANIPTQLIPDFLTPVIQGALMQYGVIPPGPVTASDQMLPLQFGTKNNLTAGATASQLIFDGQFVVGLGAAKMLVDMSKLSVDKSINDIKASAAQAYILVLVAQENLRILDSTYINMNQILDQTKAIQTNGFLEETDIEQLTLNISNLKSKLDYTRRNITLVMDMLKFQMGIDIDEPIVLKESLQSIIDRAMASSIVDKQFDINTNYDFKIIKQSQLLLHQTMKVHQAEYYPSMAAFFNTQSSAQRDKFDFFNNGKWYNTTIVGVNLSIPIWSSGIRHYKIQQDKFSILKQEIVAKQVEEGLKIDVQNSKTSMKLFIDQYYNDKNNLTLSGKIYNKTQTKFKQGMASALDLNQTYLQLLTQEGNYINTIMQLLNTYTNLSKALNTL